MITLVLLIKSFIFTVLRGILFGGRGRRTEGRGRNTRSQVEREGEAGGEGRERRVTVMDSPEGSGHGPFRDPRKVQWGLRT